MHDIVKSTLKDMLPPALMRLLRPKNEPSDAWGTVRYGLHGLRLPGGRRFIYRPSPPDRMVCAQIFFQRDYATEHLGRSQEIVDFYRACPDPIIVDAGANIGAAAVWFALTYPKAKVLAVEPDVSNYELLKRNAISFPSVVPLNAAIAATSGTLYLNDPGVGAWGYRTAEQPTDRSYAVEAMTLEQVIAKSSGTPFILKIDIEGAESDLFSRHSEELNRFPLVIIELHDWMLPRESNSRNFLKWHVEMERDFVYFNENVFSISNTIRPM
ncbi:FkbM family methyltransferase [Caballeronia sp.]|uniref:FkbM family methyltransferase n=1 Tax=Caballeronia sp. TaxID=1931223 RepID=UPI003C56437D